MQVTNGNLIPVRKQVLLIFYVAEKSLRMFLNLTFYENSSNRKVFLRKVLIEHRHQKPSCPLSQSDDVHASATRE